MSKKTMSKKDLEGLVDDLLKEVEGHASAQARLEGELDAANMMINGHVEALALAEGRAVAAQEALAGAEAQAIAAEAARVELQTQLNNALAAAHPGAAPAGNTQAAPGPDIPRPTGTGWSIREAMNVSQEDYAEIQRTIRSLVIRSQLDWTDDFRRQDADKMANLFRAARKAHPVLRRYVNNWATAAIARQYMQNKRKHAYKQGYIKKRANGMDDDGPRRRREDEDDAMGGAGTSGLSA